MKLRIQNSGWRIKRKIWSARRKNGGRLTGLKPFCSGNHRIDGRFWLVPPCDFGIASAAARFYNPHEAHEAKSLGYVFWC
jgi:hypothetical protein